MLFTKSFIKQFCEKNNNDNIKIYNLMKYNYALFNDIPNLNIIKAEHNYSNDKEYINNIINDYLYFNYLNNNESRDYIEHIIFLINNNHNFIDNNYLIYNNTIYIKVWFANSNLKDIECSNYICNQYFNSIITNINTHLKNEYQLKLIDNCELLPSIPNSNIDKFLSYKKDKKLIFYYNYEPKSGQNVPYNHENNIIYLSNKFSDYIICCSLKSNYKSDNVICLENFDYITDASCENIVKSYYCALNSDIVISFDIGACFYYSNNDFNNDFKGKWFHLSVIDYYYNKMINNIKENKKVKLINNIEEI